MENGQLIIVSGPSGAGKTTVVQRLLADCPLPLTLSVSATTRPPRPGEKDGEDYHFLSDKSFRVRREAGDFLECFEVFGRGYWYGTLKDAVEASLEAGKWVVLEIDVQGMQTVTRQMPAKTFFVRPASLEELEQRLRGRATETEETIQRRLEVAQREWQFADTYDHQIINDQIDQAAQQICELLRKPSNTASGPLTGS